MNKGVIILDGEWGFGKTTFVKMWEAQCKEEGQPVLYYDAFAHDYAEDVFSSLAAEIIAYYEEQEQSDSEFLKDVTNTAFNVAKAIAPHVLKSGLRQIGITDEVIEAAKDAIAAGYAESDVKALQQRLKGRNDEKECFLAFRKALTDIVSINKNDFPLYGPTYCRKAYHSINACINI